MVQHTHLVNMVEVACPRPCLVARRDGPDSASLLPMIVKEVTSQDYTQAECCRESEMMARDIEHSQTVSAKLD